MEKRSDEDEASGFDDTGCFSSDGVLGRDTLRPPSPNLLRTTSFWDRFRARKVIRDKTIPEANQIIVDNDILNIS